MPPIRKPWTKYAVTEKNQDQITEISHVSHIRSALRIIMDQKLKPSLVKESEVLTKEKTLVTWLSPNDWYYGSRYGQVCFCFPLESLLKRKQLYWIEALPFSTTACRLIATFNDYHHLLKAYDPEIENGPLIFRNGQYFWNKAISLQLLFDETLPTKSCSRIILTKHHNKYCSLTNPCSEKEKSMAEYKVAQLLISDLIANDFEFDLNLFTHKATGMRKTKIKPEDVLERGVNHILTIANRTKYLNTLNTKNDKVIDAIIKASMIHLTNNDTASFRRVIGVLKNYETFMESFLWLVQDRFSLSSVEEFKE